LTTLSRHFFYLPSKHPNGYFYHNKVDTAPAPTKVFNKGKGIDSEPSKRLEGKKCFKCHGYRDFLADYPNWRTLTIREVKKNPNY